jgi:polyketide cyclase/dehydrase/lipid transport protein
MDVDVSTTTVIDRPLEEVAAYASDPDNVPTWYANITSVEWKTPRPIRVGSRVAFVAKFLGRRLADTYEVAELSTARLVMRTNDGPFPDGDDVYLGSRRVPDARAARTFFVVLRVDVESSTRATS